MKTFIFTKTITQIDCFTVYWKVFRPAEDDFSKFYEKDFPTEDEARKFAENLKHDANVDGEPRCEYRKIIDLTKPKITHRKPVREDNETFSTSTEGWVGVTALEL